MAEKIYKIEEDIIYEKTRKKEVIKPRQIIMYILREDFSISYPSIGEKLGGRDHTTVIHSYEKIKKTKALILKSGSGALIEVDGGVDIANAGRLFDSGVDILVAGTTVFHSADPVVMIRDLGKAGLV